MATSSDTFDSFREEWESPTGLDGWFSVVNNRPLGMRFMITAFAFFVVGGLMALLMRTQLAVPENTFLGPEVYNQLFTMHGSTMMFLFVVPFLEGLAIYLVPLMCGSRDLAFPRLTAFSYWVYLFGGLVFYLSFLFDAVPKAGWFAYTPLSGPEFSGTEMEFWLLGLSMVELAGITAAADLAVSIFKLRAPGLSLNRMPLFVWATLIAAVSTVFAFTVLLTATVMLELDFSLGTRFFDPDRGGSSLLWQHLFWIFGHPEVYIMFLPAAGIVSMVVPVFVQRRIVGYVLIVLSLVVTGFVGFGLWVHHMYTTGLPELSLAFFTAASFMIGLASGTQIFAWIATMWRQRIRWSTSFLFVIGFIAIFVMGGITGVMVAVVPFDWQVHDSYFLVAHFHYVLVGGVVFPIFAALYYWTPKFTGHMLDETIGQWNFWLVFIGLNVTFFTMHLTGMEGMPRRVYTFPSEMGVGLHNLISTVGAFVMGIGFVLYPVNLWWSRRSRTEASANPWNGDTLEWSIASPPPVYSFHTPPVIRSRHPVWEQDMTDEPDEREKEADRETGAVRRATEALSGKPTDWRATLLTDVLTAEPQAVHALPGPDYAPFFLAFGLLVGFLGVLFDVYLLLVLGLGFGAAVALYWLWPRGHRLDTLRASRVDDRAQLPLFTTGSDAPVWWGGLLFVTIAATVFVVLFFSYFYIRLYSAEWPQGNLPVPELTWSTAALAVLFGSALPLGWGRWQLRRARPEGFTYGLTASWLLGLLFVALKGVGLRRLDFSPQVNAYGSLFWVIEGLLGVFVLVGLTLGGVTLYRMYRREYREENYLPVQIQVTSMIWFFVVVVGLGVYVTLYISPYM